jgi:hypothetical protein
MTSEKEQQLDQFREAVDRKAEAAEEASRAHPANAGGPDPEEADPGVQRSRIEDGRTQATYSVRDKNTGKGKKTADKWNQ